MTSPGGGKKWPKQKTLFEPICPKLAPRPKITVLQIPQEQVTPKTQDIVGSAKESLGMLGPAFKIYISRYSSGLVKCTALFMECQVRWKESVLIHLAVFVFPFHMSQWVQGPLQVCRLLFTTDPPDEKILVLQKKAWVCRVLLSIYISRHSSETNKMYGPFHVSAHKFLTENKFRCWIQ